MHEARSRIGAREVGKGSSWQYRPAYQTDAKSCSRLARRPCKYLLHLHTLGPSRDYCSFSGVLCCCGGERGTGTGEISFCHFRLLRKMPSDLPNLTIRDELYAWISLFLPCRGVCCLDRGFVVFKPSFYGNIQRHTSHDKYNVES